MWGTPGILPGAIAGLEAFMRSVLRIAPYAAVGCGVAAAWLANVDPALAQCFPRSSCAPQGAPGPLIGVGLPIAGAAFATLLVVRHFRRKE
jgi:hypothetical protein